jgi:hypothetical protein
LVMEKDAHRALDAIQQLLKEEAELEGVADESIPSKQDGFFASTERMR